MKTVIEMAQQTLNRDRLGFWAAGMGDLEAFAALVRADEREACAKVCEKIGNKLNGLGWKHGSLAEDIAYAIRARGNT